MKERLQGSLLPRVTLEGAFHRLQPKHHQFSLGVMSNAEGCAGQNLAVEQAGKGPPEPKVNRTSDISCLDVESDPQ